MHNYKLKYFKKLKRKTKLIMIKFYQCIRIYKYKLVSNASSVGSLALYNQPVLMTGQGKIVLSKCTLGIWPSPFYLSGYIHIEARSEHSQVIIGDGVSINNNAVIIADRTTIKIGDNTLIGTEFCVYDSDFHALDPTKRLDQDYRAAPVEIGFNVFIGSRVTVLKGVTIGDNSVIASGSVVVRNIPSDVIAGGVPAKVIRSL